MEDWAPPSGLHNMGPRGKDKHFVMSTPWQSNSEGLQWSQIGGGKNAPLQMLTCEPLNATAINATPLVPLHVLTSLRSSREK